jgi:Fe/S biogenesis protein NfuA
MVRETRAKEQEPDALALFLEVNGTANGLYTYDLWFGPRTKLGRGDCEQVEGDLAIVIPAASVERVRGALLDVSQVGGEAGLVVVNANTPPAPPAMLPPLRDLSGPVAERVVAVLDAQVNPQIAMHGGRAALVAVQGSVAYVEMSGGCQGCGMARATLSQGIAVALTDAVPEISEVVDVTDHVSGNKPYYPPARADVPG